MFYRDTTSRQRASEILGQKMAGTSQKVFTSKRPWLQAMPAETASKPNKIKSEEAQAKVLVDSSSLTMCTRVFSLHVNVPIEAVLHLNHK